MSDKYDDMAAAVLGDAGAVAAALRELGNDLDRQIDECETHGEALLERAGRAEEEVREWKCEACRHIDENGRALSSHDTHCFMKDRAERAEAKLLEKDERNERDIKEGAALFVRQKERIAELEETVAVLKETIRLGNAIPENAQIATLKARIAALEAFAAKVPHVGLNTEGTVMVIMSTGSPCATYEQRLVCADHGGQCGRPK